MLTKTNTNYENWREALDIATQDNLYIQDIISDDYAIELYEAGFDIDEAINDILTAV
jgi:hypothetical protein